jgi:hypothetical protein
MYWPVALRVQRVVCKTVIAQIQTMIRMAWRVTQLVRMAAHHLTQDHAAVEMWECHH